QRLVLRIVQEQPGVSAGEIAQLVRLDKSTLSGIFKRLEARRLLQRTADDGDRRRAQFTPGPAARSMRFVRVPTLEGAVHDIFAKASAADVRAARELVREICTRLDHQMARATGKPRRLPPDGTDNGSNRRRRSAR
ncbi:MAG TPA: MarR family transcriptional regulator, partial [Rhodanobacteraceae bacterium]